MESSNTATSSASCVINVSGTASESAAARVSRGTIFSVSQRAAFGASWRLGEWDMDSSFTYGRNEMDFTIKNTLNRSLGVASKSEFDAGGFEYDQLVMNVSGVRTADVGLASPLNIAIGVEARQETFGINAGEPDSYRNGGATLPNGSPTQSGAQVFPGFRPSNEVDEDRTAVGAYIDLEANVTDQFLASVAIRGESYSDFGENVAVKLSLRYDFTDNFALRASVQNGFKAPSLQQQYFATTSTNFIGGVPFDITTFPVSDPVAVALGAQPLDAEESLNYSLGAVARLGDLTLTIDAYRIDIDDRIVLSENLTSTDVRDYLTSLGFIGVGGGRFFINGVDTETEGVDVVVNYPLSTAAAGRFDFTLTANFNSTDVTRVPSTPQLTALPTPPVLFSRFNVLTFEEGTPDSKYAAAINWSLNRWGATLRATRAGRRGGGARAGRLQQSDAAVVLQTANALETLSRMSGVDAPSAALVGVVKGYFHLVRQPVARDSLPDGVPARLRELLAFTSDGDSIARLEADSVELVVSDGSSPLRVARGRKRGKPGNAGETREGVKRRRRRSCARTRGSSATSSVTTLAATTSRSRLAKRLAVDRLEDGLRFVFRVAPGDAQGDVARGTRGNGQ